MTSCHECGSDVAETDVFCPICGISLKPIEIDDGQSYASFDSTIVMPPPKGPIADVDNEPKGAKAEMPSDPGAAAAGPDVNEVSEGSVISDHASVASEVTLEDIEVPDIDSLVVSSSPLDEPAAGLEEVEPEPEMSEDIYEVPVPAALSELEDTAGQLFKDLEARKPGTSDLGKTSEEQQVAPNDQAVADAVEDRIPELVNDSTRDSIEAPDLTFPSENIPDSEAQTLIGRSDELPKIAEEAKPSDFEGLPSIGVVHDRAAARDEESASGTVEDVVGEQGISKPLDVPVPDDQYSTPSMFDSVRIMESPGSDSDQIGTVPHSVTPPSEPEGGDVSGAVSSESGESEKEARSQTASNIGIVDTDGRKAAKLKPLEEGAILNGRYEIVRKIGGGGMGAVYLSSDNNLGGVLRAVKEMVQSHIEEEQQEKAVQDFKRESMILSTLDHPSIPTIYDYFFDDKESRFYLVMKYISGGDLAARLRSAPEGKIDETTVTEWGIQIGDVLDYLHNQPTTIVYRDLKPSNIMIDGNTGRVMLIDFGIARSISQKEEKGVTAVGTMGYAPPELFSGNVEPRSDIYSLGSTMFHLLTGADPQSNPLLIFDFQKNPRPRQINPQLSDQVERFLMKAVEYNAGSRFGSAAEVRHFLEEHLDNLRKGNVTFGVKEIPVSVSLANQSVFCGFCGQKIVATDLFCAFCGAKQPLAQHGVHSEIYTPAPMTAKLFVVGTSDLESPTFSLEKVENLIGRRDPISNIFPEVDLSKYDPQTKISRRHAKIWREGGNFLLEDLASSNGTIIFPPGSDSRRLLPHQPCPLTNGDKIKLGDTTLHFIVG